MEKHTRFFQNKRIYTGFDGFFLKTKGFLPKMYKIFGSEMPRGGFSVSHKGFLNAIVWFCHIMVWFESLSGFNVSCSSFSVSHSCFRMPCGGLVIVSMYRVS